jgi:hypothetical protein
MRLFALLKWPDRHHLSLNFNLALEAPKSQPEKTGDGKWGHNLYFLIFFGFCGSNKLDSNSSR